MIPKATIVALCFLLSSCSLLTTSKKIPLLKKLDTSLSKTCLTAEGKGRINYLGSKYIFGLESLLDKKLWSLGLAIPTYGEEVLRFDWSEADKGRVKVFGSFYRRLIAQAGNVKNGKAQIRYLKKYLLRLGVFLKLKSISDNGKLSQYCHESKKNKFSQSGQCKIGKTKIDFTFKGQHLYFDLALSSNNLRLDLFDASDYFKRFSVYETSKSTGNKVKSPISMDLFLGTCIK
jgi:hypothetical protein